MCGHATIGTRTVVIETGLVKVTEPITQLTLDTPAGLVSAEAKVKEREDLECSILSLPKGYRSESKWIREGKIRYRIRRQFLQHTTGG